MSDTSTQSTDQAALAKAQSILAPGTAGPQSYGPGQNPFTAAANNVDVQKAAMLSAIANGGTAGRAALDQANAAIAAQRQGAIQGALAASSVRGANPGMQASIASTVGAPGQEYGADLSAAGKSFTGATDALSRGYGQYADMAKQAVPVLQAKTDQLLAAKRADAMARLSSQYNAAQEAAVLKGIEQQTAQYNEQSAADRAAAAGAKGGDASLKTLSLETPYSYGQGPLLAKSETVANTPAGIRSSSMYGQAVNDAVGAASQGHDLSTVESALLDAGYPAEVVAQVMADIRGNYQGTSSSSTSSTDSSGNVTTTRTGSKTAKGS